MKLTLISHFYNEELLMPYWIKHYVNMVDHAIMIDYKSTDNSIDIIRTLAPHWEIRKSKNEYFNTEIVDIEVMEIEEEVPEWKMVINTTEFILKPNLKDHLQAFDNTFPSFGAISTNGIWMIDSQETRSIPLDDRPLVLQRHHGFFEDEQIPLRLHPYHETYLSNGGRSRLIHNKKNGQYLPGRHMSNVPNYKDPNLLLLWFAYSPFDFVKERKLQIYNKKSKEYLDTVIQKRGVNYLECMLSTTVADLESKLKHFQQISIDLNIRPLFKNAIDQYQCQP
jgi:hypothetical protein